VRAACTGASAAPLRSIDLGHVHRFESRWEQWRPDLRVNSWKEDPDPGRGAGMLYDIGAHIIDQALLLFGPAVSVYAELDRRRNASAVDDDVFVALTHACGVHSHLWAGKLVALPGPRFRALGDRAAYIKTGFDVQEAQMGGGLRPGAPGWGHESPANYGTLGTPEEASVVPTVAGAYEHFYAGVAAALTSGAPPPVGPWDAVATLLVIEAARRSAEKGTVVELDEKAYQQAG
jgi:scyllo-inositol 2-dehydrogenase (NADP+)